jgi:hypothetical protein
VETGGLLGSAQAAVGYFGVLVFWYFGVLVFWYLVFGIAVSINKHGIGEVGWVGVMRCRPR